MPKLVLEVFVHLDDRVWFEHETTGLHLNASKCSSSVSH